VLEQFQPTKGAGSSLKEATSQAKNLNTESQLELENPISSAIGRGTGYTAGIMTGPGKLVKGAGKVLEPALGAAAKEFPVLTGALKAGAENAFAGAAMSPDNMGMGATIGGAIGAPLGAAGAIVNMAAKTADALLARGYARAAELGYPKHSQEAQAMAREELASKGLGSMKEGVAKTAASKAQSKIDEITPEAYKEAKGNPIDTMTNDIATYRKTVDDEVTAAYKPLTDNPATVEFKAPPAKGTIKDYLPEAPPPEATFADLQAYRQALDVSIRSARNQPPATTNALNTLRKDVTNKMVEVSEKSGLGGQFSYADDLYRTKKRPFFTFSAKNDPNEIADEVGTLLSSGKFKRQDMDDMITVLGGGDVGKQKVGWAVLQTAMRGAQKGETFSLTQFNTLLNKYAKLGLDDVFATPVYKETVSGINHIVAVGKEGQNMKQHFYNVYIIGPLLSTLTQSATGMKFLRFIGNQSTSATTRREAIGQLLSRGITGAFTSIADPTPTQPANNYTPIDGEAPNGN
jgi:hypothetical protein